MLPSAWSHANPVDVLGDADPARYARAVEIVAADPSSDGLLVILTPQAMTDPTRTAEELKPYTRLHGKPFLASWMGGLEVAAGRQILSDAGIPTFHYPDTAARIFNYMWKYTYNLHGLYETPSLAGQPVFFTHWQLIKYRDGRRKDPLMSPFAQSLSDTDMADLAAYYEAQRPRQRPAKIDGAKVAAGRELAALHHIDLRERVAVAVGAGAAIAKLDLGP